MANCWVKACELTQVLVISEIPSPVVHQGREMLTAEQARKTRKRIHKQQDSLFAYTVHTLSPFSIKLDLVSKGYKVC